MQNNNIVVFKSNKYTIKSKDFEGSLDLLYLLIKNNEMDIYNVNLSEITDQYIEILSKMKELDLDISSEFLVLATNLLYIKSKKLLPQTEKDSKEEDNDEDMLSEEEILNKIIEYKEYKEASVNLSNLYLKNSGRYFKSEDEQISLPKQELEENYNIDELTKIYQEIIDKNKVRINKNAKNIDKIMIVDKFTIKDTINKMKKVLLNKPKFIFNKMFSLKKCEKEEVISAFSGVLEMSKQMEVKTNQEKNFGDIEVLKRN